VVRGRRKDLGLSQAELAERASVSRKWIYEFEAGKPRAEFGLVIRVLETLGLSIDIDLSVGTHDHVEAPANGSVDLDVLLTKLREATREIQDAPIDMPRSARERKRTA
jgi:HTH-type transcriptional regulator/antitoxin HipB